MLQLIHNMISIPLQEPYCDRKKKHQQQEKSYTKPYTDQ